MRAAIARPARLLAIDAGRAAFQLVVRGGLPLLVGALVFDLNFPSSAQQWLAVAIAVPFGITVSFGVRYLVALSGFWITDSRGLPYSSEVPAVSNFSSSTS